MGPIIYLPDKSLILNDDSADNISIVDDAADGKDDDDDDEDDDGDDDS